MREEIEMTLFKEWRDLIENQTEATFKNFWEEYSGAETRIYSSILDLSLIHILNSHISSACCGVAVFPVPMAQTLSLIHI